ncbi:MAG: uroporphyrinogen-III C-methyltransferase [Hahellaceae bacterium]|nr:uroporphyrinogen-III C-methyltransferase [Hahellaceae bacterium]
MTDTQSPQMTPAPADKKPATRPESPRSDAPKPPQKTSVWPLWLAILVLLLLIGGAAGYGWMTLEQMRKDGQREWATEADILSQVNDLDGKLQPRFEKLQGLLIDKDKRINVLQRQLDDVTRSLMSNDPTNRTDWLIAEVEYLLRLANQRLNMEKDFDGALIILQSADKVLAETRETGLYPVRKAVAEEILKLQSVARADRTGLYLKLEALISQVDALNQDLFFKDSPLIEQMQKTKAEQASGQPVALTWQDRVNAALERLEKYFVIRRTDEPVEPLMAPDQIYYLQQNLRLMLEQAELALLDRNQALYESSLAKAERWIRKYFRTNDAVTKAMVNTLSTLKSEKVDAELPEIGGSLRVLKGLMESIYQRTPPQPATPPAGSTTPAPQQAPAATVEGGSA